MNRLFSLSVIPLAATATVASVMMASAPAKAISVGCPVHSVAAAISGGPCQEADKIYEFDNTLTSLAAEWRNGLTIIDTDETTLPHVHRMTYQRIGNLPWATNMNTFTLAYTIEIDPSSSLVFDEASLGVDVTAAQFGITTTKQIWSDGFNGTQSFGTLTSVNDSASTPGFLGLGGTKLYVIDTVTRTGTGNFNSFTNTYTQVPVPEPLTILGTGLALGFGGLFKSKSSKKQSVKA
jgi:hypothetical protein